MTALCCRCAGTWLLLAWDPSRLGRRLPPPCRCVLPPPCPDHPAASCTGHGVCQQAHCHCQQCTCHATRQLVIPAPPCNATGPGVQGPAPPASPALPVHRHPGRGALPWAHGEMWWRPSWEQRPWPPAAAAAAGCTAAPKQTPTHDSSESSPDHRGPPALHAASAFPGLSGVYWWQHGGSASSIHPGGACLVRPGPHAARLAQLHSGGPPPRPHVCGHRQTQVLAGCVGAVLAAVVRQGRCARMNSWVHGCSPVGHVPRWQTLTPRFMPCLAHYLVAQACCAL